MAQKERRKMEISARKWKAIVLILAVTNILFLTSIILKMREIERLRDNAKISQQDFSKPYQPPTPMEQFKNWMMKVTMEPSLAETNANIALRVARENNLGEEAIKLAQEAVFTTLFNACKRETTPNLEAYSKCGEALDAAKELLKDQNKAREVKREVLVSYRRQCANQNNEHRELYCEDAIKFAEEIGENAVDMW